MSKYVAIDFETANRDRTSACSIGLVTVSNNKIISEDVFLIKPPTDEFTFTDVHGLTWDDVKNERTFSDVWNDIERIIKDVEYLVAHNAPFDRGVLNACCENNGIDIPETPYVCTVQLARKQWKIKPTKLNNVCEVLDIELNHHEALSDARAAAKIVIQALNEGWEYSS